MEMTRDSKTRNSQGAKCLLKFATSPSAVITAEPSEHQLPGHRNALLKGNALNFSSQTHTFALAAVIKILIFIALAKSILTDFLHGL